jgi:CheY-like chemotaxis protein
MTPDDLESVETDVSKSPSFSRRALRLLIVEDDLAQVGMLGVLIGKVEADSHTKVDKTFAGTAAEASELCKGGTGRFDLVLLDYRLPGGDADTVLADIRHSLGKHAAIILMSSEAQETPMMRCLHHGADSYHIKPITDKKLAGLVSYVKAKCHFLRDRRHMCGTHGRSRSPSPLRERCDPIVRLTPDTCLAHGRRSAVHFGLMPALDAPHHAEDPPQPSPMSDAGPPVPLGTPVAIKVCNLQSIRGPPPPRHQALNCVLGRKVEEGRLFEIRELCDGELFDALAESSTVDGVPEPLAVCWLKHIVSGVAHCHAHQAIHGQLRPENVLTRNGMAKLIGFYCCGPDLASADPVRLHPVQSLDAPELAGRTQATPEELMACDMWALGVLLLQLVTGLSTSSLTPLLDAAHDARPTGRFADATTQTDKRGRSSSDAGSSRSARSECSGGTSLSSSQQEWPQGGSWGSASSICGSTGSDHHLSAHGSQHGSDEGSGVVHSPSSSPVCRELGLAQASNTGELGLAQASNTGGVGLAQASNTGELAQASNMGEVGAQEEGWSLSDHLAKITGGSSGYRSEDQSSAPLSATRLPSGTLGSSASRSCSQGSSQASSRQVRQPSEGPSLGGSVVGRQLSSAITTLITSLLRREPSERPTAAALAAALEDAYPAIPSMEARVPPDAGETLVAIPAPWLTSA